MKFHYKKLYLIAALTSFGFNVYAETAAPATLPVLTVSEKPLKTSLTQADIAQAKADIDKTAGGANIVDMDQVREGRTSNFADTLGLATGVLVQSRFGAEESRLSIRGSGLQRTFHGRGIKLMQDGIPVNLADGSFDFQAIDPMATRYIEVYRGANALRYGASTLGGAINFVSPTGYDASKAEVRAEVGSFNYQRMGISSGGVRGDVDYFVTASSYSQDGYRDNARQSAERINANVGYRINADVETRFYLGYINSDSDLPGNLRLSELNANPRQSVLSASTLQQKRDIEVTRIANKTTLRFGDTRLEVGAWYSDKNLFHPIFQVIDQDNHDYGLDARLIKESNLLGYRNEFVLGLAPSQGITQESRWNNIQGRRSTMTNRSEQTASNLETYAENRLFVMPALALITGVQYTRAKREFQDLFFASAAENESFSKTYSQTSPKLGLLYNYRSDIQLYANVSRSFEPPSFGELAGGLRPNIVNAQKGTTFEIGTRGNSTNVDWDISAYRAQLHDELLQTAVFVAGNSATPAAQTTNADRTVHIGLEMGLTARLPFNLQWRQNLLVNDFRFENDANYGNRRLPGIAPILLRAELLYRANGFYIGPTLESSQRYAVDFAETLYADGYTIFGVKLGQQYSKQLSWFVEARNLADRKYVATTSVVLNQNGADGALFLPGDGRSAYAGVQWRY